MLKSGIPDMIPEKNGLLVIDSLKKCKNAISFLVGSCLFMNRNVQREFLKTRYIGTMPRLVQT